MKKRMLALVLTLALAVGLTGCGLFAGKPDPTPTQGITVTPNLPTQTTTPEPTPTPTATPEPTPEVPKTNVRFAVLAGPTGVGAAKLLSDNEQGKTINHYDLTVAVDNPEIAAKLINDELDIACMASNVAANLYNKNKGEVQALCLSTLGVLYVLESTAEGGKPTVAELGDLMGKTVYAPSNARGANPEYVFNYLLGRYGMEPGVDVEIVWKTAQEVQAALLSGEAQYAMLPVPAATAVQVQAKKSETRDVHSVLDLTQVWDRVSDGSILTMTTVVARTEFIKENPQAVADFLKEYAASIEYVKGNPAEAAPMVVQFGIVPAEPIAKLAIPACNLTYIAGEQMRDQIMGYYQVLYKADPASIGGGIPDNAFYFGT